MSNQWLKSIRKNIIIRLIPPVNQMSDLNSVPMIKSSFQLNYIILQNQSLSNLVLKLIKNSFSERISLYK